MLQGLVLPKSPPPNRVGFHSGKNEEHLTEGAVMLAYAMHLFRTTDARRVELQPDGQHGKIFDMRVWIEAQMFAFAEALGKTAYGGVYRHSDGREIAVFPRAGIGDVVADTTSGRIVAECKGGILNTKHGGQTSHLRKGLCEAVGQLLGKPYDHETRQVAVVPMTPETLKVAKRMAPRTTRAGLSIALVDGQGRVSDIEGAPHAF